MCAALSSQEVGAVGGLRGKQKRECPFAQESVLSLCFKMRASLPFGCNPLANGGWPVGYLNYNLGHIIT